MRDPGVGDRPERLRCPDLQPGGGRRRGVVRHQVRRRPAAHQGRRDLRPRGEVGLFGDGRGRGPAGPRRPHRRDRQPERRGRAPAGAGAADGAGAIDHLPCGHLYGAEQCGASRHHPIRGAAPGQRLGRRVHCQRRTKHRRRPCYSEPQPGHRVRGAGAGGERRGRRRLVGLGHGEHERGAAGPRHGPERHARDRRACPRLDGGDRRRRLPGAVEVGDGELFDDARAYSHDQRRHDPEPRGGHGVHGAGGGDEDECGGRPLVGRRDGHADGGDPADALDRLAERLGGRRSR